MKHIFLFSGIGADHRVFKKLDLSTYHATFIEWIPALKNESIQDYARRLLEQINVKNPVLIGLSFGGVMAIEIAKLIKTEKVILLASVKTRDELPPSIKNARFFPLYKIMPDWFLTQSNFLLNWLFGAESADDKKLLADILHDTDPVFLRWALDKVVNWSNTTIHPNITHLHGTLDRIFPFRYIHNAIPVSDGGHFMTVNKPEELTRLLQQAID